MNLSFLPSLQNMAAIQIVARLCNGAEVVALIAECDELYYIDIEQLREIKKLVHEKISLLCLPTPLEEKLSCFVTSMCDEMRRWKEIHDDDFSIENIPREFCWTSRGTLDKKGMAEAFVQDPTLPEGERYGMACLYCLEWDNTVPFLPRSFLREFEAYWIYDRTGDATALDSTLVRDTSKTPYQCAFHAAVKWGNEVAAEYYFRKLSPGEREESLSDVEKPLSLHPDFDLFRFLLLHMDEGQRSKLFEECAQDVLNSLLAWPWQQFFMDVARLVRDTLSYQYCNLLIRIAQKIRKGYKDYSYRELFGQFLMEIPVAHKKEVILEPYLWKQLLPFIGEKNILLMLKDLSPEEREELLLSERGIAACRELVQDHQWDALQVFIRECVSSCDQMIHFKEECRKIIEYFGSPFFEWIDGLIEKRDGKETDCPVPHKRQCDSPGVSTDHT